MPDKEIASPDNTTAASVVGKRDILEGVRKVGVQSGDVLLAHSSLKSFGSVDGGAETVIDALLEACGGKGTLVMPTFTWSSFHDKDDALFDVVNTPSETGKITELFRLRPGVTRSPHLCHSVAASGPLAEEMLGDGISGFGKGSPFERLYDRDAWILLVGVTFTACTALHTAEEFMLVPYRQFRLYPTCKVRMPDGTIEPSKAREFLCKPNVGFTNDFGKMGAVFAERGLLRTTTVGNATITAIRIRAIIDTAMELLRKNIHYLTTKRDPIHADGLVSAHPSRHPPPLK